jgi:hypothetical protein
MGDFIAIVKKSRFRRDKFRIHTEKGKIKTIEVDGDKLLVVGVGKPDVPTATSGGIPEGELIDCAEKSIYFLRENKKGSSIGVTTDETPPIIKIKAA